jgi:wyosine [tRNA(Phe)-imidazoG37] synthetase (radical SAM superfamily)
MMLNTSMKSVYGPVPSWRLGKSLGVDLICSESKICSFDCMYCQLQKTKKITSQKESFIDIRTVEKDLQEALQKTKPDVITLSGTGEPTLSKDINNAIAMIRRNSNLPIAILTNSTMFSDNQVYNSLLKLDIIVAKLDAPNEEIFQTINRPAQGITFKQTLQAIKKLRNNFSGTFDLQMMFINENKAYASEMADIAREIKADEVQINTPLRPCAVKPLKRSELDQIENEFKGVHTLSVYKSQKPMTNPLDKLDIFKRRRLVD